MALLRDTLIQGSARVTDTLYASTFNGLTLTAASTGFTIAGGTTSKTLTVSGTATINTPTQWGIVYGGASGAYSSTAAGTSGQYLKSNGSAAPTWANLPNYDDTYVNVSGDTMTGELTVPTIISKVTQSYASSNQVIKIIHHNNSTDQDVEDAYIGGGTGGSLGIASKTMITLWPGSTSATAASTFQSSQGIRFFKDRCEPCPNYTYSIGTNGSRFTNIYATNLYGTLNTTDINGVDATNGSLEKTLNQKGNWVTNKRIFFGTCDTVAATTTKAVTCAEFSDDDLVDGTIISVRFTYQNSGAVGSLQLKVGSTDPYPIKKLYATTGLTNLNIASELCANSVVTFVFNKISDTTAYWQVVGLDYNTGVSLAAQTSNSIQLCGAQSTSASTLELTKSTVYVTSAGHLYADAVHNAVWNDYAEYRAAASYIEPGRVVIDTDNGEVILATKRLQPGAQVVSDTWGHIMGETNTAKTPLAVAGRVLVYPYKDRKEYHAGMCVCSAPNGTVDIMTRDEIKEYPDCIIGIVSEIPDYEEWGSGHVKVNKRIWVKVK